MWGDTGKAGRTHRAEARPGTADEEVRLLAVRGVVCLCNSKSCYSCNTSSDVLLSSAMALSDQSFCFNPCWAEEWPLTPDSFPSSA